MKNKTVFSVLVMVLLGAAAYGFWLWFFCRFYVGPGEMAVIRANTGTPLPPGQILAQKGQQGIQEKVLGEGRHFLNPYYYDWEIKPAVLIPPGKVGLVTVKFGKDLPQGEFIAGPGEKGIQRGVLGPGRYRLNPHGYNVDLIDATSIQIGYVGVVSGQAGDQAPAAQFAGPSQKGTRRDILQPGLYYINPKELKVDVLEVGVNQVSLLGKLGGEVYTKAVQFSQNAAINVLAANTLEQQQERRNEYLEKSSSWNPLSRSTRAANDVASARPRQNAPQQQEAVAGKMPDAPTLSFNQQVNFPSRDGFDITLDMTVEFEFTPDNIATIFKNYGDLPKVVDTIILPQILSVSRLKGSKYGAKDFIVGEGRETFQTDLTSTLATTLAGKKILIHNALIRHVNIPTQILSPIQDASVAVETDLTNREKQNTAKKQAELNTQEGMVAQYREKVLQETEKLRAEILANQENAVAQTKAETLKLTAEVNKATAEVRAEKSRTLGTAAAQIVTLVDGEKAKGFGLKAAAFKDPAAYAQWEFATKLNPDAKLNIIHTGPGTLWTDLDKARLGDIGAAKVIQQTQPPKK